MNPLTQYATDEQLEVSGIWSPLTEGVEVLVARNGTRAYARDINKEVERYSLALEAKDEAADRVSEAIIAGVMSRHILLGWRGFTDETGADVPYSTEKAKVYLGVKDFRRKISSIAEDLSNFKVKQEKAVAANL